MHLHRRASSFLDDQGPGSLEQLCLWDECYASRFQEMSLMGNRLMHNLKRGTFIATDFSGFDAPRECFRIMTQALSKEFRTEQPLPVYCVRSCDWAPVPKKTLILQSDLLDGGSSCVFSNIMDRLQPDVRDWVQEAGPTKAMSIEEAKQANELVEQFLGQPGEVLFSADGLCYCEMHRQRCPSRLSPALQSMKDGQTGAAGGESMHVSSSSALSPPKKKKAYAGGKPWYEKQFSDFLLDAAEDAPMPIVCNISGLVCTDYTPLGKQRGLQGSGLTEPFHAVWKAERAYLASLGSEDFFFTENSSAYPVHMKQIQPLQSTHEIQHITICPTDMGFPMRRRRIFTFGYDKSRWVWVGPKTTEDVQAAFTKAFGATNQLTGDVYFVESEAAVHEFAHDRAAHRKTSLPANFKAVPMKNYLACLVPPGAMVRFTQYEKIRHEKESLDGHFLVHLDHNVGTGPACGPELPSLDTHPCIYSFQQERLALASELLFAQGVDMFEQFAGKRGASPLARVFSQISDMDQRFLSGNTMHIPTFAAWLLYAIGNVMSRADLSKLPKKIPTQVAGSVLDGDGDDEVGEQPLPLQKRRRLKL